MLANIRTPGVGFPSLQSARRCRALTNLALIVAGQLPGSAREAAYQSILRTLRDHIGQPERAALAIAELLTDPGPRVA
jgi:hypothetical protein